MSGGKETQCNFGSQLQWVPTEDITQDPNYLSAIDIYELEKDCQRYVGITLIVLNQLDFIIFKTIKKRVAEGGLGV